MIVFSLLQLQINKIMLKYRLPIPIPILVILIFMIFKIKVYKKLSTTDNSLLKKVSYS